MRYCSGHNKKLPLEVGMYILVLLVFVIGICIPSPLCADTKVYDKNWNLKERIDDSGRIGGPLCRNIHSRLTMNTKQ